MDKQISTSDKRKLLAQLLRQKQEREAARGREMAHRPRAHDGRRPLSHAQTRLWLLDQLEPSSAMYTISATYRLTGTLRVGVLEAAIDEIVRRHQALRTVFRHEGGIPYQSILPFQPTPLQIVDAETARARAREPFDLSRGPLFRVALVRNDEREHTLLLDIHHIVSDAWSFKLFTQELATLYADFSRGEPSSLPTLPLQFTDWCDWERQWLDEQRLNEQLSYWKQQLAGPLPVIQLPADRMRQPKQTHRGALHRFYLPKALVEAVKTFSQAEGVTPFMTLLAGFKTLLHRYTGQRDMLVGTAFAGRGKREVHELMGFFVNTLPLRVDMSGAPSFRALLGRVREAALGAYAHQDLPFIKLVEQVQPERDNSHSPLVQIMFVLRQKAPAAEYRLPELTMSRPVEVDNGVAKFELSWSMEEEDENFLTLIEYNVDLFDRARIERLADHFVTLLGAAVGQPEQSIVTLPLLTAEERAAIEAWNPSPHEVPPICFHRIFEARVRENPDQVAVVAGEDSLTYGELDARADGLAGHLRRRGVGPEVLVGICLERSLDLIVAILAIFKAGGAYVPIDPALPQERISFVLDDARISLVLVHEATKAAIGGRASSLIDVAHIAPAPGGVAPADGESPNQLAYVIYTSGSTGRPKGVQVEHTGIHNMLRAQMETFGVTARSRILQFASISFDASIFEIVMALGSGATLVLGTQLNVGTRLLELLERQAISHATLPPSVLANLPWAELPALETIITAGEACPPRLVERWAPSRRFFNAYGPTEATVWSTVDECRPGRRVTIGTPISNTEIHILDSHLQRVPAGVPGETYIGGPGLARGYLHRPELTRQRFIDNPFGPPGSRLYRTGDLARYLDDGRIDFLGRTDDQVKLRGFRIELEEIEAAMLQHPAVREAVVLVKGEALEDKQLVAFYAHQGAAAADLRAFLKQKLPSYMVPAVFVPMAAFPLNASNKIDKQALEVPEAVSFDSSAYVAPTNAVEEIMANVWAEVLGVARVGIHDHFFELGGHSLQAVQIVSRLGDAFSRSIPLSAFFERPTIAELARLVQREGDRDRAPSAAIAPVADAAHHPLSFAQQRLWFLDSLRPGHAEYNIPTVLELRGPLNAEALCTCLDDIVLRHEALRTRFVDIDGTPAQIVADVRLRCPIVDLEHLSPHEQHEEVARLALLEAQRPFHLERDLPIRATLLRRDAGHHVLLLTIHHIVADDGSMGIFLRDLHALYTAAIQGSTPDLPALPIQYKDFAAWQRRMLTEEISEAQLAYWRRQLENLPRSSNLPTDRARPAMQTHTGDSVSHLLPATLVSALKQLSGQANCTLFMTVMAAFEALLHRYTDQDDIFIGTPIANRGHRDLEHVIGFFGNTLIMRADLSGSPTFRGLLARVRKMALEAYEHADVPFEKVAAEIGIGHDSSRAPVPQIMFAFQDASPPPARLGDAAMTVSETDNKTAKFDLVILLRPQDGGLAVRAQYATELFERGTIARMLAHFQVMLEGIIANPDQPLHALPLLTEQEIQEQSSWNATATDYPQDACVHELFEAQVQRTPDAIAVTWQDASLTYHQLNLRANRVAHRLRRLGVGPEVAVGLHMHRSLDMVVGLLGILKAGGVHVPLDPGYPEERIAFMLEDAQVSVLLTRAGLGAALPRHAARVVDIDADGASLEMESAENPAHCTHVDNIAYAIYTSGSTGVPKGVAIPHRAINRLVFNTNYIAITPADRVAQASTASFDAAIFEIWGALLHGARLVGIDKEVAISPQDFTAHLAERGITVLFLTTALFHLIANTVPSGLRSVRHVLVGGEALDAKCAREVLAHGPPERLLNVYGPTESTTFATWYLVRDLAEDATSVPIGRPLSNTRIHLFDSHLRPVPVGVPGEVYIGGAGLAREYLRRPELTAERFVRDPADPESRLYKTGDLARYLPDGNIEFIARLDHQVKLRGYRIELGEIEAALRNHPGLADAAVLLREDVPGHKRLVAYVVLQGARDAKANDLREYLGRRLPSFMVPSAFVIIDAMPLSPNGKVDRKRLAQVREVSPERGAEYVAPRSALEKTISEVWCAVLNVDRVGAHDNFFDLGGSSLLMPRAQSKLSALLGRKLQLMTLFQYPSVSSLAAFLSQETSPAPAFARAEQAANAMRSSRSRPAARRRKATY